MRFIVASNNRKKTEELRAILSQLGVEVVTLKEVGIHTDPEETGATFAENAFIKADAACRASGEPAIADDSGLVVACLGGAPGVHSARYGGELSDTERNGLLLKNMEGSSDRTARFVSHITCVFPNGDEISAEGVCEGEILTQPRGDGGFGYDPVFFLPELGKSMAQLTPEEKNAISHRGRALKAFAPRLKKYLEEA